MITYLVGTDTYRIKQYLAQHAPNAIVGEDGLKMQGLFDQAPVILYNPPAGLKIPENVEVFIVLEKKPKNKKNVLEFNLFKGAEIASWIKEEAKRQGFSIDGEAVQMLAQQYRDTWQTRLALDMLCGYAHGDGRIMGDMVKTLLPDGALPSIFGMTDAIAAKRKGDAVVRLAEQLDRGVDPYYLFSMIVGQFRNMLRATAAPAEALAKAGIHPYAASKAVTAAKRFAPGELAMLYRRLANLEYSVKTGEYDITDGLYQFIFSL